MSDLLSYCEVEQPWLRQLLESLVRLESPSDDKTAVDRCGEELARRIATLGGSVQRFPQPQRGAHVRAEFGGVMPTQVLLLGHFDTVWRVGTLESMPLHERDGRLHGPGIFDMKGGIAIAMLAVRALVATGRRMPRIVMLWTADEEVGSATSRALLEEEARRSEAVLVLEPSLPGGAAKTSRKGVGAYTVTVHGISAHAGLDPGKGASAIHELARQVLALEKLQDLQRGVTVNVGTITGGSRPNVVAERAAAELDVRVPTMADASRVDAAVRALRPIDPRTRLEIDGGIDRPPLERTAGVVRLYERARRAAARAGRDLAEGAAGGGSDGNFTAALGVPTVDGLGPEGDGAHAHHEHVLLSDLAWRAAFVAELLASFAERDPAGAQVSGEVK
jgi:glutamate carboxypeptidase